MATGVERLPLTRRYNRMAVAARKAAKTKSKMRSGRIKSKRARAKIGTHTSIQSG